MLVAWCFKVIYNMFLFQHKQLASSALTLIWHTADSIPKAYPTSHLTSASPPPHLRVTSTSPPLHLTITPPHLSPHLLGHTFTETTLLLRLMLAIFSTPHWKREDSRLDLSWPRVSLALCWIHPPAGLLRITLVTTHRSTATSPGVPRQMRYNYTLFHPVIKN